jgi:hypothetical protein
MTSVATNPVLHQRAQLAAGLLSRLCVDAHELAERSQVKKIHFFTREGVHFQRYFEQFATAAAWQITGELVYVSRLSTFAAGISTSPNPELALIRLSSQYHDLSISQLLTSIGQTVIPNELSGLLTQPHIAKLRGNLLIQELARNALWCEWLSRHTLDRHSTLTDYLQTHHADIFKKQTAVIIDIGWRGTIQDNLAWAYPDCQWNGLYIGLFPFNNPQPPNTQKQATLFATGTRPDGQAAGDLFVIEYLFHARMGSVIGYEHGEARHLPEGTLQGTHYAQSFQQALLALATQNGQKWRQANQATQGELKSQWLTQAWDFWASCQTMDSELFTALKAFSHDEHFGLGQHVQLLKIFSLKHLVRSVFSREARGLFIQHSLTIPPSLRRVPHISRWHQIWFFVYGVFKSTQHLIQNNRL